MKTVPYHSYIHTLLSLLDVSHHYLHLNSFANMVYSSPRQFKKKPNRRQNDFSRCTGNNAECA